MKNNSLIQKNRYKNITSIMINEGLSNNELADAINMWPQNLSRAMNKKITDSLCKNIHNAFPYYREDWIRGESDYMTDEEYFIHNEKEEWKKQEALLYIINNTFKVHGFQLKLCVVGETFNEYKPNEKDGYYILKYPEDTSGEFLKILSSEEYLKLVEEIEHYSEYLIQKIVYSLSEEHKGNLNDLIKKYIKKWMKEDLSSEVINKRLNMIQKGMKEQEIKKMFDNL